MKPFLLSLLFLCLSCSLMAQTPPKAKVLKHLVLDIDWTIVTEIKDPNMIVNPASRVIEVQGIRYFINEGLEELIEEALSYPDVKISFFSGGKRKRNKELLSKIKLRNGKSLKDIAYKIKSKEDLKKNEKALVGSAFSERLKKDLTLISPDFRQIVMFDDTPNFVLNTLVNQSDSVFFLGKAFEYFDKFEDTIGKSGEYVPVDEEAWLLNRKKLYIMLEAFKSSYKLSQTGPLSLLENMKKFEEQLDLKSLKWNAFSEALYEQAMESLGNNSPDRCREWFRYLSITIDNYNSSQLTLLLKSNST